jgi:endonuclease/exonuclease/phosphatase family metal-dependent hydrolase
VSDVDGSDALRVATWNIRNGKAVNDGLNAWWFRRKAAVEAVEDLDADVVGLQEAYEFQLRYLERRLPHHVAVGFGRDDGRRKGEQSPLLGRIGRVELTELRTRWFSDEPDHPGSRLPGATHPRIATLALVRDLEAGRDLHVANVHLDQRRSDNRMRSLELLLGWMEGKRPLLLLGDLNAGADSPETTFLEAEGFVSAVPQDAGGTAHDWAGGEDGHRIDHIFLSEGLVAEAWEIPRKRFRGRLGSDHWPVAASLRFS